MNTITIEKSTQPFFFANLKWITLARGRDETRPHMSCIRVESDKTIIATDGNRMHWLESDHLIPEGCYSVQSTAKLIVLQRINVNFPAWESVIPRYLAPRKWSVGERVGDGISGSIALATGNVYSHKLLLECLGMEAKKHGHYRLGKKLTIETEAGEGNPLVTRFEIGDCVANALLMPRYEMQDVKEIV